MGRHRAAGALFGVRRRVGRRRIRRRVLLRRHARARALDRCGGHRRAHLRGAAAQRVSVPSEAHKRLHAGARARASEWRGGLVCTNGARAAKRAHRGQPAGHDHARYDWNRKSAQRCAVRAAWGVSRRRRAQTPMLSTRQHEARDATTRRGRTPTQSSAVQHARCSELRDATPVRALAGSPYGCLLTRPSRGARRAHLDRRRSGRRPCRKQRASSACGRRAGAQASAPR